MEELLAQVIAKLKKNRDYHDVSGKLWVPGSSRLERCPNGCHLEISEMPVNWEPVRGHDAYRQTRICRAHGFARIYLVSGPTAAAHNWNPSLDLKHPDFEEAKSVGVIGDFWELKGIERSLNEGMRVTVQYYGRKVHLLMKEQLGKGEYRGQIIGFSPPTQAFKDLSLDEEVMFRAANIGWIFK